MTLACYVMQLSADGAAIANSRVSNEISVFWFLLLAVFAEYWIPEMTADGRGTQLKRKLIDMGSDSDNEIESEYNFMWSNIIRNLNQYILNIHCSFNKMQKNTVYVLRLSDVSRVISFALAIIFITVCSGSSEKINSGESRDRLGFRVRSTRHETNGKIAGGFSGVLRQVVGDAPSQNAVRPYIRRQAAN